MIVNCRKCGADVTLAERAGLHTSSILAHWILELDSLCKECYYKKIAQEERDAQNKEEE